ncbi:MAG: response regulator transcription factor [Cyanobacteria bacterium]|nr:response regulator transcription factor [Cyanobacteriota bacterium]
MQRILLVDDEVALTQPLGDLLRREGYGLDVVGDGRAGQRLVEANAYDLLILDWMLPELSGLELCRWLRSRGDETPVLFLTAKDTLDDRVGGLDAGADDYLVKPFELRELLARVRALLRRSLTLTAAAAAGDRPEDRDQAPSQPKREPLRWEDLSLESENQLARRGDRAIDLSEKETQLLDYFLRHPERLLTHGDLSRHLWPGDDKPSSNALAAQIRLLRRKIEAPGEQQLIHTVYGKGYRLGGGPS